MFSNCVLFILTLANKGLTHSPHDSITQTEEEDDEVYYDTKSNPEYWVCKVISWHYSLTGFGFDNINIFKTIYFFNYLTQLMTQLFDIIMKTFHPLIF